MSYVCEKCNRNFKAQQYLDIHLKRKTICTNKYICTKCKKDFISQRHLDRHLERLTTCAPDEIPVIIGDNSENRCQYCNKTYATKSSLTRHQKTCDKQVNMAAIMNMLQNLTTNYESVTKELAQLKGSPTIVNNNNVYNNNLYVGNELCIFGEEDYTLLDQNKVSKMLLDDAPKFVPRLIREIHANPDLPQYHNVFYDMKTNQAMIFTRVMINGVLVSTWQKKDMKEVSIQLVDKAKRYPTCMPLAQNIRPNSLAEQQYCKSLKFVTQEYKHSDLDIDATKKILTMVTAHPCFANMVENTTHVSGMLPLIHLN